VSADPDEATLAEKATALADGIEAAVRPWVVGAVVQRAGEGARSAAEGVADATADHVVPQVRALLATDIDQQSTTPLALLRSAVGPANDLLSELGVPPAERDDFARQAFPDDVHDLAPVAFEDVAPELRLLGIEWGAAKAYVHLKRRRAPEGPGSGR
jgi:hypothetical protein